MFVDRHEELAFLNRLLTRKQPGPAQMLLLYGRRRVGKTELLKHWCQQSGVEYTYWAADKEPAALQRRSFMATMLEMPEEQATVFDSWPALWRWLAPRLAERPDRGLCRMRRKVSVIINITYPASYPILYCSYTIHAISPWFPQGGAWNGPMPV